MASQIHTGSCSSIIITPPCVGEVYITCITPPHLYAASADLNTVENSSLGDIMEESDWELNSVVVMATGETRVAVKGSTQAEKEIR